MCSFKTKVLLVLLLLSKGKTIVLVVWKIIYLRILSTLDFFSYSIIKSSSSTFFHQTGPILVKENVFLCSCSFTSYSYRIKLFAASVSLEGAAFVPLKSL